ncbi:hypothetical protein RHO13_12810 [Orbus wheelerorum]|uniref:hypothetical protein n=1 Tax=Orbus wheelerorum TaxID=3074111 RepID=UPI00370D0BB7
MKKIFLVISVVLSLLVISSSSYAQSNPKNEGASGASGIEIRLIGAFPDWTTVYCYYEKSSNGVVVGYYRKDFKSWAFNGCPSS